MVFDRESGKPKGYGFCEYKDQETALSAMRNLNGYEIGGRTLRVDNACTEKSRMEMQQLLQGPQVENPYGDPCEPENAPEIITKTVASLPPEQMYELMKQMKACIQNNPAEAKQMLLLNPQLAYALLQAQVVMRIVDPNLAVKMLQKPNEMPPVLLSTSTVQFPTQSVSTNSSQQIPLPVPAPQNINQNNMGNAFSSNVQDIDLRSIDPRLRQTMDQDMRSVPTNIMPNQLDNNYQRNTRGNPSGPVPFNADPRQRPIDPRKQQQQQQQIPPQPVSAPIIPVPQQQAVQPAPRNIPVGIPNDASDQEKAALIMQVLQLSDEQIAMLPPEQRTSIVTLKEQIAKSTQR